jgi:hypothetical protein
MSNALTLHDRSPGLRKVVGRESPRATLAEEPDAGNPLVRIWRGAELGNRSAYSTSHFSRELTPRRLPAPGPCPHRELFQPYPHASGWGELGRPPGRPRGVRAAAREQSGIMASFADTRGNL